MKCRITYQGDEERRFAEIIAACARSCFPDRRVRVKLDDSHPPLIILYITVIDREHRKVV